MKFKANFVEKPGNFQMDDCQIEKVVELSHEDFCRLKIAPLENQPFLAENKDCMFSRDGVIHCLLVLDQDGNDGVLVDAERYDCARLAAYVPGMRDIVNAEMDRAADFIVREGTKHTTSGNWIVDFDELEEQLGLVIRQGNGLYEMLLNKMTRRPEVLDVQMTPDEIDTVYYSDFCPDLEEDEPPDISPTRKAMLFDNTIGALLQQYKGEDIFAMLHDQIGLTLEEIAVRNFLPEDHLRHTDPLSRSVLEDGLRVRDLFHAETLPDDVFLMNEQRNCRFSLDGLKGLIDAGNEVPSDLLDASVTDIARAFDETTNIVISGITQEEMFHIKDVIENQTQTPEDKQAIGPVM